MQDRVSRGARPAAYLALGCVGFIASAGHAQQAANTPPEDGEPTELEGVTVTDTEATEPGYQAREASSPKFTAPLIDTPRSVTIIPSQVIRDTGSNSLVEALRTVPGITFGAGEGGNPLGDRPFIRGFDSQASTYLDGVRDIGAQSREVFAIDSIEVIKGSDSVVGGRGSAGGTLNLVSKLPQRDTFLAGSASYGFDDYKRATADLNYRVSDLVGVRLNALWHDQDVAGRDALRQKRWGIAPSVTIGMDGPTKLSIWYYHLESDEIPDSGIPFQYTIANIPAGQTTTRPAEEVDGRHVDRSNFYGLTARDYRDTNVNEATMRVEREVSPALTIRNTTRYGRSSQDYIWTNPDDSAGNVATGLVARSPKSRFGYADLWVDQLDLFGRFATGPIEHSYSAGGELAYESASRAAYTIVSTPRCTPTTPPGTAPYNCTSLFDPDPNEPWSGAITEGVPTLTDATTKALYAFDTMSLGEALKVNLGLRYDDYGTRVRTTGAHYERDDDFVSVQAGVVFKPAPNGSLYASYSTANTPPGSFLGEGSDPNGFSATVNTDDLKVERTKSYEIGAKWDLFGERLSLTLAGFRTDTANARTIGENGTVSFIGNRRIDGIEFGFNGAITPEWNVFGGYTYLDSEIRDGGFTSFTVAGTTRSITGPSVNTGEQFPNTPKHSFTAWTSYAVTPALKLGGGAFYTARQYGGYQDNRRAALVDDQVVLVPATATLARYVPSYWRFDATASYRLTENVELQVNVQNLTDKRYYTSIYTTHYAAIAPGRTAFATVNLKF